MSRRLQFSHEDVNLEHELLGILNTLDGLASTIATIEATLLDLRTYLALERLYSQTVGGYVENGAGQQYPCFFEASFAVTGVRVYAETIDDLQPSTNPDIWINNITQGDIQTGTLNSWTSGRGQMDIDIEINEGDEIAVKVDQTNKKTTFNIKLTPDVATFTRELGG